MIHYQYFGNGKHLSIIREKKLPQVFTALTALLVTAAMDTLYKLVGKTIQNYANFDFLNKQVY